MVDFKKMEKIPIAADEKDWQAWNFKVSGLP